MLESASRGGGVSPSEGVLHLGVCLVSGGFSIWGSSPSGGSAWSRGGFSIRGLGVGGGGLPGPRGGFSTQGVLHPGGYGIPACTEADTPPPGQTHTCKNITLATTSLRPAINNKETASWAIQQWFPHTAHHTKFSMRSSNPEGGGYPMVQNTSLFWDV